MMALEEKFDLTLDEEGKCHTRSTNVACPVMHTSLLVLFSTASHPFLQILPLLTALRFFGRCGENHNSTRSS